MQTNTILYIGNDLIKKTKYPSTQNILSKMLCSEGFIVHKKSQKNNKFYRLLDMVLSVYLYRKKIDFLLIDTYSTSNFYYALLTSQLARFLKINYIPILHGGNLPERLKKSPKNSSHIFKNSYKNISPSFYLHKKFKEVGYNSIIIPNIIQIENYLFKKRTFFSPKLLYVRAFAEIYNPVMAIEVLRQLKIVYPNASLCMIGPDRDGSLNDVKAKIEAYNLKDNVEITGALSKEKWLTKSEEFDIFINTTNFDNMPVSVIEAMALGLPVVSTNVGGIPFLIENNKDGILVGKNNVDAMVKAIIEIIKNKNTNLAIHARQKVEEFSWQKTRGKWLEILNNVS